MQNSLLKKGLVLGIIVLFIGIGVAPIIECSHIKNGLGKHAASYQSDCWAFLIDSKGALFPTMLDVLCLNGWQIENIRTLEGGQATKGNFYSYFQWLDSMEDSEDTVLFYYHGHGAENYFYLNHELMPYSELDKQLDDLESESIAVIIDSCYSGSAIDYLSQNGRVIITSAKASEPSASFTLTELLFYGLEELADYLFKGNNDGYVSAEEAYWYAVNTGAFWKYSRACVYGQGQSPQIDDGYNGELQITNISYRNDQLDQYQCFGGTVTSTYGKNWLAQSFKPGVKNITRIKLNLGKQGNPGDLTISIRKSLSGDELAVLTVPQNIISNWTRWIDLDLEDISVTPWDTYYIVCRGPNGDNYNKYYWMPCEETYSRGSGFITEDSGESWELLSDKFSSDFPFFVFGKDKTQEKPPTPPSIIDGPKYGSIGHYYTYHANFVGEEPMYFKFSWGDGTYSGWLGPYNSGESCEAKHEYDMPGTYRIRVAVKGSLDVESDWSTELNVCIMEPVSIIGTISDLSETENYFYIKPGTLLYLYSKMPMFGTFTVLSRFIDIFPILGAFLHFQPWDIIISKEYDGKLGSHFISGRFNALILTHDAPID
jgi:hypothetical protein